MNDFAAMGEKTGGRSFDPSAVSSVMVRAILGAVVADVKSEYVVGYDPAAVAQTKKRRRVEVRFAKGAKVKGKLMGGRRLLGQ